MSKQIIAWEDSRGKLHNTAVEADQTDAFLFLNDKFKEFLRIFPNPDSDQIVNQLYENREAIRWYLNLTEQMIQEAMK